ncbi:hypothetical protein SS50377_21273 [Spironucleus salmonicida]|uniref:Uncharacterized protein n=1 Tax=Spironucleus salmonicida TaxID=348837 RepID=V6LHL0_9EUKA|nr:hypothetical protein SS50377_21273 [Spironucleus salmonicida]|eukprot:EST44042.1 hypothetical protein SS50377_16353 [Spironucleus salmonicida]
MESCLLQFIKQNKEATINSDEDYSKHITQYLSLVDTEKQDLIEIPKFYQPLHVKQPSNELIEFINICRINTMDSFVKDLTSLNADEVELLIHKNTQGAIFGYDTYLILKEKLMSLNPVFEDLLTVELFALLPTVDPTLSKKQKAIFKNDFVQAIRHIIDAAVLRFNIDPYCEQPGYITSQALQDFLQDNYKSFIGNIFNDIMEAMYMCYAVKSIQFFLDPKKTNKISVKNLLISPYLHAALSQNTTLPMPRQFGTYSQSPWFSRQCFENVYNAFSMATDPTTGLLPIKNINNLPFPPSQVFAKSWYFIEQTYDDQLDFRGYMDYALTHTFPCNTGAGYFVFSVLDAESQKGYLSQQDINLAFKGVFQQLLDIYDQIPIPQDAFIDEIYENIKPQNKSKIYLSDILKSNSSEFMVRYLMTSQSLNERENACQGGCMELNNPGFEIK